MGVFRTLGDGIADLSELQVQTLTGELTTQVRSGDKDNVLDWEKLIEQAKTETEGSIRLIAATTLKFDGDTNLFFAESAPERLIKAHNDAVESARKVREGLLAMFHDLLDLG
ncbi:MAG: hypothetical protein ACE5HU_01680 [Acidobacteriota bacterium]